MNKSDDFFKNISKTFRDTMGTVGKKTDEFVEIQKIRNRQGQLESRIENHYQKIGSKIYSRFRNGEAFDEQLAELCREIMRMEKEIDACKEQVAEKKGQVLCPSCGAGVPKEASFCMYCGAQLPEKKEDTTEDADFTEVPEDAFEPEDESAEKSGEAVHADKDISGKTSVEDEDSATADEQE